MVQPPDALIGYGNCTSLSYTCSTAHSENVEAMGAALSSSVRQFKHLHEVELVVEQEG